MQRDERGLEGVTPGVPRLLRLRSGSRAEVPMRNGRPLIIGGKVLVRFPVGLQMSPTVAGNAVVVWPHRLPRPDTTGRHGQQS